LTTFSSLSLVTHPTGMTHLKVKLYWVVGMSVACMVRGSYRLYPELGRRRWDLIVLFKFVIKLVTAFRCA